jgi:cellulose biosynthesis protein BcsQ
MAKRIVLFNHKGGVSKTTSAYNIAWKLAQDHNVLLVDADPQCNLSSLLLMDNFDSYYLDEETKKNNIRDGVEAAFRGKPEPIVASTCYSAPRNPNLQLLAGHQNLSEFEAALTFAQNSNNALATLGNLPGAFNALLALTEEKYKINYTVIDLNPSLSSINQNLLLSSDYLIVPTNPDPFSIMALNTLMTILPQWAKWQTQNAPGFKDSSYPMPDTPPVLLGTLIQRFNVRRGKAAKPYRDNIAEIKLATKGGLLPALRNVNMTLTDDQYGEVLLDQSLCLSEISDFQGVLPKSLAIGVPVFAIEDNEIGETGPVLAGMKANRDRFNGIFSLINDNLLRMMES